MKKATKKTAGESAAIKAVNKTPAQKPARETVASAKASLKRGPTVTAGVPNIDYSLCQGCGGCAEAFPHLFAMRGERAWLIDANAYDPARDEGILKVCPYYAISIEKV